MRAETVTRRPLPPFGPEHEELRGEIRRFVAEELRPHADEWEAARWFPNEVFHRMAELGLLGIKYPVEYGGRGAGYVEDAILSEELGRCGSGRTRALARSGSTRSWPSSRSTASGSSRTRSRTASAW